MYEYTIHVFLIGESYETYFSGSSSRLQDTALLKIGYCIRVEGNAVKRTNQKVETTWLLYSTGIGIGTEYRGLELG